MTLSLDILQASLSEEQTALAGFQAAVAALQTQLESANRDVLSSQARSADLQDGIKRLSAVSTVLPGAITK